MFSILLGTLGVIITLIIDTTHELFIKLLPLGILVFGALTLITLLVWKAQEAPLPQHTNIDRGFYQPDIFTAMIVFGAITVIMLVIYFAIAKEE